MPVTYETGTVHSENMFSPPNYTLAILDISENLGPHEFKLLTSGVG
jgi:hypothetical protein